MAKSQVSSIAWMLEGDYFEGCNCDVVCPCIFFSNPTEGNCHVTCAWHIQNGKYGDTDLNNLNVVAMFNSPGNMFTGPKWKAALYIDETASLEQKDLITKIFSGQAGGFFAAATNFIGEMLGVKSLPIEFGVDGKRRWIKVKDAIELDIEAIAGGDKNRDSVVVNPPFSVVPGADMTIAKSSKYNYSDHGMEWNNSGKNGFYCRFKYTA
ncbi:MAG TPA: DUF1326 domain-containing protein [Nitrososphaeraceae archaeon]|jgi:hypothetical protein